MTQTLRKPEIAFIVAIILACVGLQRLNISVKASERVTPIALPASAIVHAMDVALKAKPGQILSVQNKNRNGKYVCEVNIFALDGNAYKIFVDNAVSQVEDIEKVKPTSVRPMKRKGALNGREPFRDYSQQSYRYWELYGSI